MCHTLCGVLNCRASCYTQTVVVIRLPELELTTAIMPIEIVRRLHAIQVYEKCAAASQPHIGQKLLAE
jgi:hypothetical protein